LFYDKINDDDGDGDDGEVRPSSVNGAMLCWSNALMRPITTVIQQLTFMNSLSRIMDKGMGFFMDWVHYPQFLHSVADIG